MVCHVCANTQSHYSVVVQLKFPLSKVRVITSGSGPPVFPSSCHSACDEHKVLSDLGWMRVSHS